MLLEIKKQISETVEIKTPCYYKDNYGHHFINENGQLITARDKIITMWEPGQMYYNSSIEEIVRQGEPCDKEEFEKAYMTVLNKLDEAVSRIEI